MAIAASVLMAEGRCYCGTGASTAARLKFALYRRWLLALDPAADVSQNGLLAYAACFCGSGGSLAEQLEIAFLAKIAEFLTVSSLVDSFVERSGITDQTQIDSLTALVTSARSNGWWDKSDVIYPFVGGTATAHAQNLKSSDYTITWAGTVTHDADGITGNGVDGVGDMGYSPAANGVQYQLNSAHATVYRRTMGAFPNTWYFGSAGGGSDMSLRQTLGFVQLALNGGGFGHSTVALGLVAASRTSAAAVVGYSPDGSTVIVSPSITIPSVDASVLAITGTDGVPGNFTGANLAFLTVGGGISAAEYATMEADIQTFQTANGRAV